MTGTASASARGIGIGSAIAIAAGAVLAIGSIHAPVARAGDRPEWHDYNGDGAGDLAIGIPGETVSRQPRAGAVQVLYGGDGTGLSATGQQLWHEGKLTTTDGPGEDDEFGSALASGDFDADGFSDLAIGIPGEDIERLVDGADRGALVILWGSQGGLREDSRIVSEIGPAEDARLGHALVALDMFHRTDDSATVVDGIADLAIGLGGKTVRLQPGGVRSFVTNHVARRLVSTSGRLLDRLIFAAGNVDTDAPDELVVGMPDVNVMLDGNTRLVPRAGRIAIVQRVNAARPNDVSVAEFIQEDFGLESESIDFFGLAVAVGQLAGSATSPEEVAVGIPGEDVNGVPDAGAIMVGITSPAGFATATMTQATANVADAPEDGDGFGSALAIADFDGAAPADLAIGVPGEKIGTPDGAGALILCRNGCLSSSRAFQLRSQNSSGVPGSAQANDNFAAALVAADFNEDGRLDLAIGVPNENQPNGVDDAGAVNTLYGRATGLVPRQGEPLWTQAAANIPNAPGRDDNFGRSLGPEAIRTPPDEPQP